MFKKQRLKFLQIFVLTVCLAGLPLKPTFAQFVEKTEDNRIIAKLKIDGSSGLYNAIYSGNSFIDSVELDIEWWVLLGNPVYTYKVKWSRSDVFRFGEGGKYPLTRKTLEKYPDLQKRFDDLVPSDIKMAIKFKARRKDRSTRQSPSPNLFDLKTGAEFEVRIQKTPHFHIMKSDEVGFVLSPASPKSWQSFMRPKFLPNSSNANTLIKNTWAASDMFLFDRSDALKVTKVVPPTSALNNIAAEYWRREKKEEDKKAEDDFWSGEDDASEENAESNAEDDFWNDTGTDAEERDGSDFWSGEGTIEEEVAVEEHVAKATGQQFLGSQTTKSRKIKVSYFDHGQIDGDRVSLYRNGEIVANNITLGRSKRTTNITLDKGVNRISFKALNNGSAGNNTAKFDVAAEDGTILFSRQWNISAGYQATLIVIRE